MTTRRDVPPTLSSQRDGLRPRSPAEALEPGRAPARPRGVKPLREPNRKVSGAVRVLSGLLTLSLVTIAVIATAGLMLRHEVNRPGPLEMTKAVVIPKGTTRNDMADRLHSEGVINSPWTFVVASLMSEWTGERKGQTLKFGDYEFKKGASLREVLETIVDGKSILAKLTIPEGLTSYQIIERIKAEPSLSGEIAAVPAEGALFPDTYRFSKGMNRQELVDQMVSKQKEVLEALWAKRQEGLPIQTPEQALVLASIVEKETGRADERERVAAVFVNRLKKNMRLESDPTILYGLYGGQVQWGKPILKSEIDAKNAHNTYTIKGLPPTPICNPGRATIEATLNPAKTDEVYFVADGTGGHIFSTNLKDHNAAVAKWRKTEKVIRANEKEETKAAAGEAKPETASPPQAVGPAKAAAPAAAAPLATKTDLNKAGQRAVVKTVPPPAGNAIPNPPAEQPVKATAQPAAKSPVKTVPPAKPAEAAAQSDETSGVPLSVKKPQAAN